MKRIAVDHARHSAKIPVEPAPPTGGQDPSTGLPGEPALRARVAQALARPGSCAVLAIACDDLKQDLEAGEEALGHALAGLVRRLRRHCGPGDFLAQVGDSRFALLLTGIRDRDSVEHVAGAVVHDLGRPLETGARPAAPWSGAAVGVAVAGPGPGAVRDARALCGAAGAALEEALARGGEQYWIRA